MITAEDVATMLGISRGAVYDLAAPKGPLPCVGLGRRLVRFKVADVEALILACTHSQMAPKFNMKISRTPVKLTVSEPLNCFERRGMKPKPKLKPKR
ncbi:helix-turn-helix domain-containing protein [Massilia sp. DWR3-1-1]|uniref:helix-turn-helix domain-containing protein n=1 Tax=Massilia sp. DWR3-1-1 TaxID=2804559 RepID=UPI003CF634D3